LQRVITDFGADVSFGRVPQKMKEHYGIEVPISAARALTEEHGEAMLGLQPVRELGKGGARSMIAEMDGSMIPTVSIENGEKGRKIRGDKRKRRQLGWREARLCLARDPRSVAAHYRATMGDPEQAGWQMVECVAEAGGGKSTRLHCVGDGAPWIQSQFQERFGGQASYLIDFYHVSGYLAGASELLAQSKKASWLGQQQRRLKSNRINDVLTELIKLEAIEQPGLTSLTGKPVPSKEEHPASACKRYLENRLEHLDYQAALKARLPISSGEVESGHRSVIQARLKLAGAWWKIDNAEKMLKLRTVRANDQWETYWRQLRQAAA
jgi:hypothetical protein